MSTMNNEDEESAAFTDGVWALRQALTAENMGYATDRCTEEYARALDAAQRTADAAGMGGSDRRAYLTHMDTHTRARVLAEATARRDEEVRFANQQFAEWRRATAARARSIPQSLYQFNEG